MTIPIDPDRVVEIAKKQSVEDARESIQYRLDLELRAHGERPTVTVGRQSLEILMKEAFRC